ncbi:SCO2584 family spore wall biosynthesis protein [Streptomyces niveus]|uniref:SCO2584 family spore wall biosynthesis protein n=1 Tax=Streptomyces niveus TaxID=193462 RepID=UPI0036606D86
MPDDVGGKPFPDGWEPDDDRGGADEDFASVVFDEDFIRSAPVHEPTAVERLLAAAQARAEAARARAYGGSSDDDRYEDGYGRPGEYGAERPYGAAYDPDDPHGDFGPYGPHGGALRPYRGSARWHRPVAWLLAVVMGIGMVALAFTAVYRGASGNRQDRVPPPATTGVDTSHGGGGPVTPEEYAVPVPKVSAVPRSTP